MNERVDDFDLYALLDVNCDATQDAIRSSYRTLMQRAHPDHGGDTLTAARLNRAYAVLGDPARRADYDARRAVLARIARGFDDERTDRPATASTQAPLDPASHCIFCGTRHGFGHSIEADAVCTVCASPLAIADTLSAHSADQRGLLRISRRLRVLFYTDPAQDRGYAARTEDFSLRGVRLIARQQLRPGQCIRLVSPVLEAVGRVTHCSQRTAGFRLDSVAGISFVTLRILRPSGGLVSRRA